MMMMIMMMFFCIYFVYDDYNQEKRVMREYSGETK